MRQLIRAAALIGAMPALAEAPVWTPMTGSEIRDALEGRVLQYKDAWQDFRPSGKTRYVAGRESWGYWRIEDDRYCSQWPPSSLWACYTMDRSGDRLRFVGSSPQDVTEGVYKTDE